MKWFWQKDKRPAMIVMGIAKDRERLNEYTNFIRISDDDFKLVTRAELHIRIEEWPISYQDVWFNGQKEEVPVTLANICLCDSTGARRHVQLVTMDAIAGKELEVVYEHTKW